MAENKEDKALRYLASGHVSVVEASPGHAVVHVTSDSGGDPYICKMRAGDWECDCPAQVRCSHIIACMVIFPPYVGPLIPQASADDLDSLLDG